jgi:hypothetical protein
MMQSCASAAKLRAAGPFCTAASKPWFYVGSPPPRIVIGRPQHRPAKLVVLSSLPFHVVAYEAGRKTMPSDTSPAVTRRQRAMSSFRANATIIVLRVLPRPSAVRA